MGSNTKKQEPINKPIQKLGKRDEERQLLLYQSLKTDNYMGSKRKKSNIAVAIFGAPTLFSPTVHRRFYNYELRWIVVNTLLQPESQNFLDPG